jgi:hypothetical protein
MATIRQRFWRRHFGKLAWISGYDEREMNNREIYIDDPAHSSSVHT